jgi:hypothetical protein
MLLSCERARPRRGCDPSTRNITSVDTRSARLLLLAQGAGYVATGAWPIISMRTFEAVTGPKHDDWLVRIVGALAVVIGGGLVMGRDHPLVVRPFAVGGAIAFTAADVIGVASGRLGRIYLLDAAIESVLLAAWGADALQRGSRRRSGR